ncbi:cysteine hydrolase family protein [Tengunoibacter tsumagoiensis]|uniref:Nicotinamidase n=1 Tax=Tengunoibacter tsumagoiensis TaxID=2014871 RepID=A0A401ZXB0_9CHLR|nr:isochorismatase family cysteine hydrolase [Tengunoibacter tsumagoiensis]GCE11486.1 nicotinamidase [Tengunoibacter tsumagoiensis]
MEQLEQNTRSVEQFLQRSAPFLTAVASWEQQLSDLSWQSLQTEAEQGKVAVFSIDMVNGFCHEGPLSSSRVKGIIPEVVNVFEQAYRIGVRQFVMAQDSHTPESIEFADFPPHCQVNTSEAENIPELANLPFAHLYTTIAKNSLNAFHGTELAAWLDEHKDLSTVIVVGDCTDLCVYQTAMHLKLHANAYNLPLRVIVPANAVQTYDTPVEVAQEIGALAHDGDVLNLIFLYHMYLNGIEVVRKVNG